jgi:hypothetical protein
MDMSAILRGVTTPLSLIVFVLIDITYVYMKTAAKRAPPAELPPKQQAEIVIEQIRSERIRYVLFIVVVCLTLCSALVLAWLWK